MRDTVLVRVAAATERHRIVGEEQRPLATVGLVTFGALEILMGQMPSLLARLRTAGVVALGAQSSGLSPQQARAISGVRVVAGDTLPAAGRNMGKRLRA